MSGKTGSVTAGGITIIDSKGNVTATNFFGNLSGNVIGDVTGTVSSLSNFTTLDVSFGNVTATNLFGNLNGDIIADGNILISNKNTGNISLLGNNIDIMGSHDFSITHSGNITLSPIFGDLILNPIQGDVDINPQFGDINLNPIFFGNININRSPKISSITGNTNGSSINITGNMPDPNTSHYWYPLMYNPVLKELRFGPPPY